MRFGRWWWVLALFGVMCASSFAWHWSGGIRIARSALRVEAQRGEVAVSLWLGSGGDRMDAPLFFAHAADSRTRLSDASRGRIAGLGWRLSLRNEPDTPRSVGIVAPWWWCLAGLLILSQAGRLLARIGRPGQWGRGGSSQDERGTSKEPDPTNENS